METMGRTKTSRMAISTTESAINRVTVLPITAVARLCSPAPMGRPMLTVEPIARPTIITVIMCMTWLPTETAVVLAAPSNWPIMNRSAMP